jgi:hypothetical protein
MTHKDECKNLRRLYKPYESWYTYVLEQHHGRAKKEGRVD